MPKIGFLLIKESITTYPIKKYRAKTLEAIYPPKIDIAKKLIVIKLKTVLDFFALR